MIPLAGPVIAALAFSGTTYAAPHFVVNNVKIDDLGTLGGSNAAANDVNDSGDIVGWSHTAAGQQSAFHFSGGFMKDIGASISTGPSVATGINNVGQIVGLADLNQQVMGYLWSAGQTQVLLGPSPTSPQAPTVAWKINDRGDVAGNVQLSRFRSDAVTWHSSGSTIQMPSPATDTKALDINAYGSMTGYAGTRAWRWTLKGGVVTGSREVPSVAGQRYMDGVGRAINDRGEVVGRYLLSRVGRLRAFFWDGRSTQSLDIGVLPNGGITSQAEDINEERFIAGHANEQSSVGPGIYQTRAFLYHADFGMYALPILPRMQDEEPCRAYALNERQPKGTEILVVGECFLANERRAVVWTVDVSLVP